MNKTIEHSIETMGLKIKEVLHSRAEHVERYTAAFLKQAGSLEATKYKLVETWRTCPEVGIAQEITWTFEKIVPDTSANLVDRADLGAILKKAAEHALGASERLAQMPTAILGMTAQQLAIRAHGRGCAFYEVLAWIKAPSLPDLAQIGEPPAQTEKECKHTCCITSPEGRTQCADCRAFPNESEKAVGRNCHCTVTGLNGAPWTCPHGNKFNWYGAESGTDSAT